MRRTGAGSLSRGGRRLVHSRILTPWAAALSLLVPMVALIPVGSAAPSAPAASTTVLAVYQTNYITEQGNFTVSMQVSDSTNIQFVYFTFCQLSSPVCYLPIAMTPHGSNWYVGTTKPMSNYNGMSIGAIAGYNITIEFKDNTTQTQPAIPNPFTNLTISTSVTGEYMFQMVVSPNVYTLSGVVTNPATGAPVAGATVSLGPVTNLTTTTDSSGAYTFSGLVNGSYSLSVSSPGYMAAVQAVTISGQDVVKNVAVSAASSGGNGSGGGGTPTVLGLNLWLFVAVVGIVLATILGLLIVRSRRRGGRTPPATPPEPSAP